MPKTKTKQYKIGAQKRSAAVLKYAAGLICLAVVVAASAFVAYIQRHDHRELGQYNVSDTYVGEDLFRSLDLKLAAKAGYPSGAISIAQDLGSLDQLHEQIFQFNVNDDGLQEYGLMLVPSSPRPPAGYPVLILLHGYVDANQYSTTEAYLPDMDFYARQGFLVLKPDFRGQGYSINAGHSDSAYYSMAYNTDLMSLISAVKKTPYADKANINLWGHSMGAYIALRAAVLSKDVKNAILLSGPIGSLREMYLTYIAPSDEDNPYAIATRNDVFAKYGTPVEDGRFWNDASPIDQLGAIKARLQIHAGLQDSIVPARFSADLDAALTKHHINHQYFAYPEGGHGLSAERTQIYSASLQLMLPRPAQPQA